MDTKKLLELVQSEISKAVSAAMEAVAAAVEAEGTEGTETGEVAASAEGGAQKDADNAGQTTEAPAANASPSLTKEDVAKMISDSVPDAVSKAIEPLMKFAGAPTNLNGIQPAEKAKPDAWDGYFLPKEG